MKAYQAGLAQLKETQVFGVSINRVETNASFARQLGLTFPLLCDTKREVSKRYGVLGFFRTSKRATFVIDKAGIIRQITQGTAALNPRAAFDAVRQLDQAMPPLLPRG